MAYLLAGKNCQGVRMKERESDRKKRQEKKKGTPCINSDHSELNYRSYD